MVCEALPALQEAKKAGKIGHTGITGLPLQGILVYPTPAPTLNCCLLPVVDYVLENSEAEIETILTYCCYTIQNVNLDQAPPPSPPPASQNVNLDQYLPRWKPRNLGIIQVSSPRAARRAGEGGGTVNPNGSGPSPLGDLVRAHGQVSSAGGVDGVSVLACGWGSG